MIYLKDCLSSDHISVLRNTANTVRSSKFIIDSIDSSKYTTNFYDKSKETFVIRDISAITEQMSICNTFVKSNYPNLYINFIGFSTFEKTELDSNVSKNIFSWYSNYSKLNKVNHYNNINHKLDFKNNYVCIIPIDDIYVGFPQENMEMDHDNMQMENPFMLYSPGDTFFIEQEDITINYGSVYNQGGMLCFMIMYQTNPLTPLQMGNYKTIYTNTTIEQISNYGNKMEGTNWNTENPYEMI